MCSKPTFSTSATYVLVGEIVHSFFSFITHNFISCFTTLCLKFTPNLHIKGTRGLKDTNIPLIYPTHKSHPLICCRFVIVSSQTTSNFTHLGVSKPIPVSNWPPKNATSGLPSNYERAFMLDGRECDNFLSSNCWVPHPTLIPHPIPNSTWWCN